MLRAVSGERRRSPSSPWWRQAATLLGAIGLFVTLLFNTLAVRQSAQQDHQARETAQISLLTQLNSNASDSERAIICTRYAARAAWGRRLSRPVVTAPPARNNNFT
jgi:hypothetical protein